MDSLWSTYGLPMDFLWNNTVATPEQYLDSSGCPRQPVGQPPANGRSSGRALDVMQLGSRRCYASVFRDAGSKKWAWGMSKASQTRWFTLKSSVARTRATKEWAWLAKWR